MQLLSWICLSDRFVYKMNFAIMADAPEVNRAPVAQSEETRVRREFPETWLWTFERAK